MQSFGLLLLLLAGTHAAQFRVTRPNLSVGRQGPCSAAWGNLVLFAGAATPFNRDKVVDIFEDGVRTGGANLTVGRGNCVTASASPGVIAISEFTTVEFFDVAARTFHPYNSSLRLSGFARSGVGSLTSGIMAFVVNSGTVDVLSSTSQRILGSFSLARRDAYATRVMATGGQEYFLFVAGTRTSVAVADVTVLPVSSPLVPVSPTSQLAHARSDPTCATTSLNVVVCVGGKDATGTDVTEADICTIDAVGALACTSRTYADTSFARTAVPLGPFVAFMPRLFRGKDLTVSDTSTMQEIEIESLPSAWLIATFTSVGAGRFAYMATGSAGGLGGPYLSNVTVVECLAPCQLPLQGSSSTIGTSTSGTTTTTGASTSATATSATTTIGMGTTSASQGSDGPTLTVSIGLIVAAMMLTSLFEWIWTFGVFLVGAVAVYGLLGKKAPGGADAKKVE